MSRNLGSGDSLLLPRDVDHISILISWGGLCDIEVLAAICKADGTALSAEAFANLQQPQAHGVVMGVNPGQASIENFSINLHKVIEDGGRRIPLMVRVADAVRGNGATSCFLSMSSIFVMLTNPTGSVEFGDYLLNDTVLHTQRNGDCNAMVIGELRFDADTGWRFDILDAGYKMTIPFPRPLQNS